MSDPATAIGAISPTVEVIRLLADLLKGQRGTKRKLLLELQRNLELISLHTEGETPIEKVIPKLQTREFEQALNQNYNFANLQKGKIGEKVIETPFERQYLGWTTEALISNIFLKIKTLQDILEIDPQNQEYRKSVRLINIRKMIILLLKHIGT